MTLNEHLQQKYNKIFQNEAYAKLLDKIRRHSELNLKTFSGLFLSKCDEACAEAKNKIMVVGRETRGWNIDSNETDSTEEYLKKSMDTNRNWVNEKKNLKGARFFGFYHDIEKRCGKAGIIWANTYAVDYKKSHPRRARADYPLIEALSGELLLAQIAIMQPQIIIFCGGGGSVASRRKYLQQDEGKNMNAPETFAGVSNRQLWKFELDNGTLCYRIQHPASFRQEARMARNHLFNLLPAQ